VASIRRIERLNYGIGAILIAVAALTQARPIALGVAVGVLLTCLNFFVLRKLVIKWTTDAAAGRTSNASFLMLPKMIALMGAVAVAVLVLPIDVIAFTIGYSIFMVSIIVEITYSALRAQPDQPQPPSMTDPTHPTEASEHTHG
jgi:ATP synthase I subunit